MKAAIVALALLVGAVAHAQAPGAEEQAVLDAFAANRTAEMYELATALVAKRPDDPWARYLAALAAERTVRYDEMRAHLGAGLAKAPDDPDLLSLRALSRLSAGDERGARADARRVLEVAPDNVDAQQVLADVELADRARERANGPGRGLTPGSAAAFVDAWIEKIAHGASGASIGAAMDPGMLESIDRTASAAELARAMSAAIDGVLETMARVARDNQQVFLGWIVASEERVDGDTTWVDVQVPVEMTITAVQGRGMLAAAEDPSLRGVVAADSLRLVEGVPPDQRAALVDRLVGTRQRTVMPIAFQTRGAGPERRIVDIEINGISARSQMNAMSTLMRRADPDGTLAYRPPRRDRAYQAGKAVGYFLGIALVLYFVVRLRRRF